MGACIARVVDGAARCRLPAHELCMSLRGLEAFRLLVRRHAQRLCKRLAQRPQRRLLLGGCSRDSRDGGRGRGWHDVAVEAATQLTHLKDTWKRFGLG